MEIAGCESESECRSVSILGIIEWVETLCINLLMRIDNYLRIQIEY